MTIPAPENKNVLGPPDPPDVQDVFANNCGLSIDMLDVDRLRQWANNLLVYGSDISQWGDRVFVAGRMQQIATGIEKAVKDIGVMRALLSPETQHDER